MNNLASYYTDKILPGVGISIGLTLLFYVLEEQGYLNDDLLTAPADVLILPMTADLTSAILLATSLREAGIRRAASLRGKKIQASSPMPTGSTFPLPFFWGRTRRGGKVTIKDLSSGEQVTAAPSEAVAIVRAGLAKRAGGKPIREKRTD
jgi:histidyl-tRNA synthetase